MDIGVVDAGLVRRGARRPEVGSRRRVAALGQVVDAAGRKSAADAAVARADEAAVPLLGQRDLHADERPLRGRELQAHDGHGRKLVVVSLARKAQFAVGGREDFDDSPVLDGHAF